MSPIKLVIYTAIIIVLTSVIVINYIEEDSFMRGYYHGKIDTLEEINKNHSNKQSY